MKLQVIRNDKGQPAGVFIPIEEWNALKDKLEELQALEYEEPGKEKLKAEIQEAVENLKLVRQGKLKARPAKELLDEL